MNGECGYCGKWGHKRTDRRKRQRDTGGKGGAAGSPPAGGAAQQVSNGPPGESSQQQVFRDDSADCGVWIFMIGFVTTGALGRFHALVDSGADEHVCPHGFAPKVASQLFDVGSMCDG